MIVQELIDKLQAIEDKTLLVCRGDSENGGFPVVEVTIETADASFYQASRKSYWVENGTVSPVVVVE